MFSNNRCRSDILNIYDDKVIIPIDVLQTTEISNEGNTNIVKVNKINKDKIGIDIGPETIKLFSDYIEKSGTIIWNGPVGMFEYDKFSNGTKEICNALASSHAITIVGGGDTGAAVIKFGLKDKMTHVSTGGGASLELLEGKKLPGIEIINNK